MSDRTRRRLGWANLIVGIGTAGFVISEIAFMLTGGLEVTAIRILDVIFKTGLAVVLGIQGWMVLRASPSG